MKLLVLAAIIVAVSSSGGLSGEQNNNSGENRQPDNGLWQVGQVYKYEVESHTLAYLPESSKSGNTFRARFILRVKAPGRIQAKLEKPEYAQVHQEMRKQDPMPQDLKYQTAQNLDKPFEIRVNGGRVVSIKLPSSVPLPQENLLKGLISALQADLSTHRNEHSNHDTYDDSIKQGLFRKMETDVTGDCETLYAISPVASEWRRELPQFATEEEPIEITKSKNYGHCHHRVDYHFGVPNGAEWTGTAHHTRKEQLIKRATVSRILAGRNGPIYKAETTSTVNVHPHLYGKQEAEVHSKVSLQLVAYGKDDQPDWETPEDNREVQNLLYSLTQKSVSIHGSSQESSESQEHRRSPRSTKSKALNNKRITKREHDNSNQLSSSSSSSDSESSYVNDDIPRNNEPAYAALYLNPQPHNNQKQNLVNAQKLTQELAQQLQNPNNMPKADVLSKFNVLVRIIASMTSSQLNQAGRSMEAGISNKDPVKADMWMIYRDAVAQAGTLPAFQQIMNWIQNKKLQGVEASIVVSTLSRSLRYPTKQTMTQFFETAMSPEVREQLHFNATALLAATTFINLGQVNNNSAHHRYPTHIYGRLSQQHDHFVTDEILPRLKQELQEAVQNEDSHKTQVYIKAIGNLGHRAILDVFAPYLNGEKPASTYIRQQMVENLQVLAFQHDKHARVVLYSILRNAAEPYQVRVAAIQNIFAAQPSSTMMQGMAEMTHNDPSIEVRAALKSAILSAADLKNPRYLNLARTANAAKGILTKEKFSPKYSQQIFYENYEDDASDNVNVFVTSGARDDLLPSVFKYIWKNRKEGYEKRNTFSASTTNTHRLVEWVMELFNPSERDSRQNQGEPNHKYSANKIAEKLNFRQDEKPFEASLYINILNQQYLSTISEQDKKEVAQKIKDYLTSNSRMHHTNTFNKNQVSIMFPIASGMPFIFKYKEPTMVRVRRDAKKVSKSSDSALDTDQEIDYTYAQNHDGSVGFLDTLSNHVASVGIVKKLQIHIPIRIQVKAKSGEVNVNVRPLESQQDTTLVHYSVWPYSANQQKDSLHTVSFDKNTQLISRPHHVVSVDNKYGLTVGSVFQIEGYSNSEDYRNIELILQSSNPLSQLINAYQQKDFAQTHFNLRYLGKQSKSEDISFRAVSDTFYNQKEGGQMSLIASDIKEPANSEKRREELIKRVVTGIDSAQTRVFDLSATFNMPEKREYTLTFAVADSQADPKVQFSLNTGVNFNKKPQSQFNIVGAIQKPEINTLNFQEALKNDLKMKMEADVRYGKNGNIHLKGEAWRSNKYTEELQNHHTAKKCNEESSQGNNYQHSCHKMIVMANTPNSFKQTITYKDLPCQGWHVAASQIQKVASAHWQSNINPTKTVSQCGEGKVEVNGEANYWRHSLSMKTSTIDGELLLMDIPIPRSTPGVFSLHTPIPFHEQVLNYNTNYQYKPYCTIDKSQVKTFSNRQYNYTLSRTWHVVMQNQRRNQQEQLALLARRPKQEELDFYISYRSPYGKDLEIEVKPGSGSGQYNIKVNTNANKVSEGDLKMYWEDKEQRPLLEYNTGKNGVLKMNIRENRLRILYDGQRLVTFASADRNNNRGICGRMSGEPRDDYLTPNGLVDQSQHYGASYALIDDNTDPETQELQNQAKKVAYQPKKRYTAILQSDEQWKRTLESSSSEEDSASGNVYRARSYSKGQTPCKLQKQVQYYENYGEICITTKPLQSCPSHCSSGNHKVQGAQVVCRPKLDQQFQTLRDQIRQGQNPKVNGVPQAKQYQVPGSCKA